MARNVGIACHAQVVTRSTLQVLAIWILVCVTALALGCWLRVVNAPEWLAADPAHPEQGVRPFAVEADCYSQLARVQRILHGEGLVQNHFKVENWPEGLIPSTTAPFDYVILLLYAPLTLFTKYPLDWAGALVSPALWVGLVFFWMFFRSREFNWVGRALLVVGSATLPALIWGTACGRPRHQSLILALMAIGLTAEYERWHMELAHKRMWNILAGAVWGLACWTSLFEPTLVVLVLVIFNLVVRRREDFDFLVSFGAVMLVALVVEHVHIFNFFSLSPEYYAALQRWLGTIAEVRGISLASFVQQITCLFFVLLVPFISWRLWRREGDNWTDRLLIVLTFLLAFLAFVQLRWFYYANLAELFLLVRYCQVTPTRWTRLLVMTIFLFGVAYDNDIQVEGNKAAGPNLPSPQLLTIARSIDEPGGIMAPWWLSPGLLYFSGHPIVSGSSHCGITGIVASANFYSTTSWVEAEKILQQRQVRWVVTFDDPGLYYPVLNTSRGILGLPLYTQDTGEADNTVAQILINDRAVPTAFQLRAVTQEMKLYKYVPEAGP